MKVFAFGASNSSKSINKALVTYATSLLDGATVEVADLNDFALPIFSVDIESERGVPDLAHQFRAKIGEADALVISFAEHNGYLTAAYKNLSDWMSRIDRSIYQDKPVVLLSTSPGPGGGRNSLGAMLASAPHIGMDVKASMSVPRFYDNFDGENGRLTNDELQAELEAVLATLK